MIRGEHMSSFSTAINEFLSRATSSGTLRDLEHATGEVHEKIAEASPEERDAALRRLSAELPGMHPVPAAKVAITCGAIVENGGDPHISGPAIIPLLPGSLDGAIRFHELCEEKARADGTLQESEDEDAPEAEDLAQKYFKTIHAEAPEAAWAFLGENEVTLAVISHLARSKKLRSAARGMPELLRKSLDHDRLHRGGHSFLTKMLLVLDDEPLLVLDTDQNKGYRATFSAIPDNFQLHTVLMGHLFGDPNDGWIEAQGFDMDAVRHAMSHLCDRTAPTLSGAFNLWNWTGLQGDGTLPQANTASDHWIWNEGVPADIVPFEGLRVVILGPPPYSRSWRGGLIFGGMLPEFVVTEKLREPDVLAWFQKLAAAPKPSKAQQG
jgi:hypothetical protein